MCRFGQVALPFPHQGFRGRFILFLSAEGAVAAHVVVPELIEAVSVINPQDAVHQHILHTEVDVHLVLVIPEGVLPADDSDHAPDPAGQLEGLTAVEFADIGLRESETVKPGIVRNDRRVDDDLCDLFRVRDGPRLFRRQAVEPDQVIIQHDDDPLIKMP